MLNQKHKPKLVNVLKLRCLICGEEPLQEKKSWLKFRKGCRQCGYLYEREDGYFTGASWVIGYGFISVISLAPAIFFIVKYPHISSNLILFIASIFACLSGFMFFPYSRSIWMYLDQIFHPIEDHEKNQTIDS